VATVAESGITTATDLRHLAELGFDAALVGEALVTAAEPDVALRALRGVDATAGAPPR
jgi:indole-3-glycerol phosphate synthase